MYRKRFSRIFIWLGLTTAACDLPAMAHPPVSLVMDSRGNIFYSDLKNVWMIQPDGSKTIAVANVHTHELWLSAEDVLFGEDVTNSGDNYRHRVWKRHPDGRIEDEIPWRSGHPTELADYAFARDAELLSYILRHADKKIDVRDEQGKLLRSIGYGQFEGFPHWLMALPDGTAYFTVGDALLKIAPNAKAVSKVADGLVERSLPFAFVHDRHALMGLWPGKAGEVYVAVYRGQVVKKITADGQVSAVVRSKGMWSPAGGLLADDGALWILEFSSSNKTRLRRIAKDGRETIF